MTSLVLQGLFSKYSFFNIDLFKPELINIDTIVIIYSKIIDLTLKP